MPYSDFTKKMRLSPTRGLFYSRCAYAFNMWRDRARSHLDFLGGFEPLLPEELEILIQIQERMRLPFEPTSRGFLRALLCQISVEGLTAEVMNRLHN